MKTTMKFCAVFLGALALQAQQVTISDTLTNAVGGGSFTGRVTVTLNAPGNASPLYYSTTSLAGWQAVYCLGVTGADCTTTANAGVFAATLYANSTITPAGTSYAARFQPTKGSPWSETWVVGASDTKLYQIRSTTVPTPTTTFTAGQLALAAGSLVYGSSAGVGTALAAGTNGQVLALSGGYPGWTTNIAGNAGTATALAANPANCSAGQFPLGVDASGAAESCTALPTTITGTANQITASAATGAVTLSLPATITGLTSVTSTGFVGALTGNVTGNVSGSSGSTTGNASTATALSSTVTSGRLWIGNGTGVPTSDSVICADTTNHRLGVGTCSPSVNLHSQGLFGVTAGAASYPTGIGGIYAHYSTVSNIGTIIAVTSGTAGRQLDLSGYPLTFSSSQTATEIARFAATTGNLLIGTTTDLGYGLHAASKGTNGNLLCFDPTSTTGVTTCDFKAGAGQSGNSMLRILNNAGSIIGYWGSGGSIGLTGTLASISGDLNIDSASASSVLLRPAGTEKLRLAATSLQLPGTSFLIALSNDGTPYGTKDLSLSRSAANTLQVGDGGANANGIILATRAGFTGVAVSALPAAAAGNAGNVAYVTDANATTIGSTVAAGGANKVLVWSNGTAWKIYAN